jgi:hypothetical protein
LYWVLLIVIQHMSQDILCVLKPLGHLCVVAIESLIKGHGRSLSLFINVGYKPIFTIQEDFGVVLEVDLNYFVGESEHNSMLRPHPFLYVDCSWWILQFICLV